MRQPELFAALSPSPGHRLARFGRRYFFHLTPFLPFPHTAEPGLRLDFFVLVTQTNAQTNTIKAINI